MRQIKSTDRKDTKPTLMHGIDKKGNRDGKHNQAVHLFSNVLVIRNCQNCHRGTRQDNGNVHPCQECSFVRKEHLWFDFDRCLSWLDRSDLCDTNVLLVAPAAVPPQ